MFPRAQIRPSGPDHIVIDTFGEFDMAFLAWLKSIEKKHGFLAIWDHKQTYKIPIRFIKEAEMELRKYYTTVEVVQAIPQTPVTYRVEYIGACKRRVDTCKNLWGQQVQTCSTCNGRGFTNQTLSRMGTIGTKCLVCGGSGRETTTATTEPYASAWSNGDWSLIFPETVLRKFFPQQVKFDGNFHRALLSGAELNKTYKQLSRQFHPDIKGGSHEMFVKLRKAFDDLKDPQRRKRYEAGLRFAAKEPEEAVVFRVPRTCGDVTATVEAYNSNEWGGSCRNCGRSAGLCNCGEQHGRRSKLRVTTIFSWDDITDAAGRVMSTRFRDINRDPPFEVEWNYTGEFEVDL